MGLQNVQIQENKLHGKSKFPLGQLLEVGQSHTKDGLKVGCREVLLSLGLTFFHWPLGSLHLFVMIWFWLLQLNSSCYTSVFTTHFFLLSDGRWTPCCPCDATVSTVVQVAGSTSGGFGFFTFSSSWENFFSSGSALWWLKNKTTKSHRRNDGWPSSTNLSLPTFAQAHSERHLSCLLFLYGTCENQRAKGTWWPCAPAFYGAEELLVWNSLNGYPLLTIFHPCTCTDL